MLKQGTLKIGIYLSILKIKYCPCCGGLVKPKNYYFYECNYQIDYVKEEGEAYSRGSINGIAKDEKYKYFDEKESGNAIFVKLVFHVTKLI